MKAIEKAAYLAHSKTKGYLNRLDRTRDLISKHPGYCSSVSWGKDSVAMVHLATQTLGEHRAINARYPNHNERFRDMDEVRDALLNRDDMRTINYQEVDTPGEWEMYEREGGGGFLTAETKKQREVCRWWKDNFVSNLEAASLSMGADGHFVGLCAEESRGRRMCLYVHGQSYERADGMKIALPMGWWSAKDIWAYHVVNNLPSLIIYDLSAEGRCRARSGFVFSTTGTENTLPRHGVWKEWERIYPDEFNEWIAAFPRLMEGVL